MLPHIKSGKLKAYAVTTRYRIDSLPDVPTMQEAGIAGFDAAQWYVIATPQGVPADVVDRLNGWINTIAASASAEMRPALLASGSVAGKHTAQQTQEFVDANTQRWKMLAEKAKLDLQ